MTTALSSHTPPDAQAIIAALVAHNMASRRMFTAWDLTRVFQAYQAKTGNPVDRHQNLKHHVHDLYTGGQMPQYRRTLRDVGGNGVPAWVYHHFQDDPSEYGQPHTVILPIPGPDTVIQIASQTALPQLGTQQGSVPPFTTALQTRRRHLKGVHGKTLDSKRRIRFPKAVLDLAGFVPGCRVHLQVLDDLSAIRLDAHAPGGNSRMYTVDSRGNLRASVRSSGFQGGEEFEFIAPRRGYVLAKPIAPLS